MLTGYTPTGAGAKGSQPWLDPVEGFIRDAFIAKRVLPWAGVLRLQPFQGALFAAEGPARRAAAQRAAQGA